MGRGQKRGGEGAGDLTLPLFPPTSSAGVEQLMYIKEDLIIPHVSPGGGWGQVGPLPLPPMLWPHPR